MAEITINGFELPDDNLTANNITQSDISSSDSGRGETGVMNITYVRIGVRKIDIELTNISGEKYAALMTALKNKPQTVTYADKSGAVQTMTAYNSDITDNLKFIDGSGTRYYDVSFSLTEI